MTNPYQRDTPAWMFFVWVSFTLSVSLMMVGIYYMPVDLWIKGYLLMGLIFTVGSSFTLSKTLRDDFEAQRKQQQAETTASKPHEYGSRIT